MDKDKVLVGKPPLILEGYSEDGDGHELENKKWKEALTDVNKFNIEKLTEATDLANLSKWVMEDQTLCERVPTHQYMGPKTKGRGLTTRDGKFNPETSAPLDLSKASEPEVKQKARQIRTSIKHVVNYIAKVEDDVVNTGKNAFNDMEKGRAKKVMDGVRDKKTFLEELDKAMQRH